MSELMKVPIKQNYKPKIINLRKFNLIHISNNIKTKK